jgi:hypothetical protein
MSVVFAAGAGFTGYRLFLASATSSTSFYSFFQAGDDPDYGPLDAQLSLDLGREGGDFLRIARILKAVKCASVGNRAHQCCKLQRSLRDLFAQS